jgi:hypothetical protein
MATRVDAPTIFTKNPLDLQQGAMSMTKSRGILRCACVTRTGRLLTAVENMFRERKPGRV